MAESQPDSPGLERILSKKQLLEFIPYTSQHIARLEKEGKFPKRVQLGPNRVGWFESDILNWMKALKTRRDGNIIYYTLDDQHIAALLREADYHADHIQQGLGDHPYPLEHRGP